MQLYIRIQGAMGSTVRAAFDDFDVSTETVISGPIVDDGTLHGVLNRLRDLNLQVLDVKVGGRGNTTTENRS